MPEEKTYLPQEKSETTLALGKDNLLFDDLVKHFVIRIYPSSGSIIWGFGLTVRLKAGQKITGRPMNSPKTGDSL